MQCENNYNRNSKLSTLMTRNGKIARLSSHIREQLNTRIFNGEMGKQILKWLNQVPEVKGNAMLLEESPIISESNLTNWKNGGYRDWLRHKQALEMVDSMRDQANEIEVDPADEEVDFKEAVSDRLAVVVASRLAQATIGLRLGEIEDDEQDKPDPKQEWKRLKEINQELARLRREDHRLAKMKMEHEEREAKAEVLIRREINRFKTMDLCSKGLFKTPVASAEAANLQKRADEGAMKRPGSLE
jgi:hypothetical protein